MADVARQILDSSRPGALDVCLRQSPTRRDRLTFTWSAGDLVFDDSAAYPVLVSIVAHAGAWRWDRTFGTLLHTLRRERGATGSQLAAYVRDGGAQVELAGLASAVSGRAERRAPGRWHLRVAWVAAGKARALELDA